MTCCGWREVTCFSCHSPDCSAIRHLHPVPCRNSALRRWFLCKKGYCKCVLQTGTAIYKSLREIFPPLASMLRKRQFRDSTCCTFTMCLQYVLIVQNFWPLCHPIRFLVLGLEWCKQTEGQFHQRLLGPIVWQLLDHLIVTMDSWLADCTVPMHVSDDDVLAYTHLLR